MPKNKKVNFTHEPNPTDETIDNLRTEKEALEQQVLELQKKISTNCNWNAIYWKKPVKY